MQPQAARCCIQDQPLPFRYCIAGNPKINFFEPKKLPEGSNLMELRYSMFGAAYLSTDGGGLKMVPQTTVARTLWEVACCHLFIYFFWNPAIQLVSV